MTFLVRQAGQSDQRLLGGSVTWRGGIRHGGAKGRRARWGQEPCEGDVWAEQTVVIKLCKCEDVAYSLFLTDVSKENKLFLISVVFCLKQCMEKVENNFCFFAVGLQNK